MDAGLLIDSASWSSEKCVNLLRRTEMFGKFPYGALRALLSASRLISLKKSRRLFAENDAAQSGFMLAEGVLRYNLGGASERPIYLTPPAVIGETALVIDCLRPVTVTAETDSVLIEIPRATFLARHRRISGKRGADAPAVLRPFAQAGRRTRRRAASPRRDRLGQSVRERRPLRRRHPPCM